MIFVDTNVLMYAVGGAHPLRDEVRARLSASAPGELATSAEVLQELFHRYLPAGRWVQFDAALRLVHDRIPVWPIDRDDVELGRHLADRHPALTARDLLHLATAVNHEATGMWSYDRGLAAAWRRR